MQTQTLTPADCILPAQAILGEGPLWRPEDQTLWWVDIEAPALHRFDPATSAAQTWPMPERLGCIARAPDNRLILALASGLAWFDCATGDIKPFQPIEAEQRASRLNDGRTDRQGRLWIGSMQVAEPRPASGTLYRCIPGAAPVPVLADITIPNSLAVTPDGRTLYFADSPSRRIQAFELDPATGDLGAPRLFATIADDEGVPDGATIDAEACLWVAHYGAARITRFRPDGQRDRVLHLPVNRPTCCAFGGGDMATLFITTAAEPGDPLSGGLFATRPGVSGLPDAPFAA